MPVENNIIRYELYQQNPNGDGYILSSLMDGTRTWIPNSSGEAVTWKGAWVSAFYNYNEWVTDGPWGAIVNNPTGTDDRAGPQPIGEPFDIYEGTMANSQVSAKQVLFGNRYTITNAGYINSYRIFTVVGNHYIVYLVNDPSGTPVTTQLLDFVATEGGWETKSIQQVIVKSGVVFDLVIQVNEPDPTPITWSADWEYLTPNNIGVPTSGQIVHPGKDTEHLYINYIDDSVTDRTTALQALTVGDTIDTNGVSWSIQDIDTTNGTYIIFGVAPAVQTSPIGTYTFIFETVTATPISYGKDLDYWLTSPYTAQGLYIADGDYDTIVLDDSAYGADIQVQTALISDDWDIVSYSGAGGGGSSDGGTAIEIADDLVTQDAAKALSANQGYVLDQAKYNKTATDTLLQAKEDSLGNPSVDDYILSSKISGTRSWIVAPTGGSTVWGDITGSLSDQTDLQNALDNKADASEMFFGHNGIVSQTFSTIIAVNFATIVRNDSYTHNLVSGGSEITINNTGWYKVHYTVGCAATTNSRSDAEHILMVNSVAVPGGKSYSYHRTTNDGDQSASISVIVQLTSGDVLTVASDTEGSQTIATLTDACSLLIESI